MAKYRITALLLVIAMLLTGCDATAVIQPSPELPDDDPPIAPFTAAPTPTPVPTPTPTPEPTPEPEPRKLVALTFDDGPSRKTLRDGGLLELLEQYDAKCTFFVLGENIAGKEDVLQRLVEAGHTIGNHSWSHPFFRKLPQADQQQEIESTAQAIFEACGQWPELFRPPYGAWDWKAKELFEHTLVYWDADSLDWSFRDADLTYEHTLPQVYEGAIILMHEIYDASVLAAEYLLETLTAEGYQFVTVEELQAWQAEQLALKAEAAAESAEDTAEEAAEEESDEPAGAEADEQQDGQEAESDSEP